MVAKTGGSDCYLVFIGNSNNLGFAVRSNIPNKLEPNRPLFGSAAFEQTEQTRTCTVRQANSATFFNVLKIDHTILVDQEKPLPEPIDGLFGQQ
jgi:hypothetical protein